MFNKMFNKITHKEVYEKEDVDAFLYRLALIEKRADSFKMLLRNFQKEQRDSMKHLLKQINLLSDKVDVKNNERD